MSNDTAYTPARVVNICPDLHIGDRVKVTTCYQYSANYSYEGKIIGVNNDTADGDPSYIVLENPGSYLGRYIGSSEYYRVRKIG